MRQSVRVLLTLTTTHRPARDLGFLLHKHPDRVQEFRQSFGTAMVFYPEATDERCTAALLLEVDPVALTRSRSRATPEFSLAQYVNDRSYAASSLLGVALADVFGTARGGRCASRQELADSAIPLEITVPVLPCRGGVEMAHRLFEPMGWRLNAAAIPLDERFPEWGESRYVRLELAGMVRLFSATTIASTSSSAIVASGTPIVCTVRRPLRTRLFARSVAPVKSSAMQPSRGTLTCPPSAA